MLNYLKSLIDANTPQRVCAFLAITAGLSLSIGFFAVVFKGNNIGLATISAGLVTLATFSKIDRAPAISEETKIEEKDTTN